MQLASTVETKTYPVLSGAFLIALAVALVAVSWAVGTESYPYIHRRIVYRFPLATLDRVYLIALAVLAVHYAAYVAHYLMVGSRQQAGPPPPLTFSPAKFVITWFLLIGLAGAYALGASIATPALFDAAFGPARDTSFMRVWNHTYFGFVLITPASWTVMTFAMIFLVLELQTRLEEQHLIALHGRSYLEYAGTVGRFFPGLGKLV